MVLNNLFLTTACATVFVGTLYPLVLESITGAKISVGAPFFNATFVPLFIILLLLLPLGPFLPWKRADIFAASQRLMFAAISALAAMAVTYVWTKEGPILAVFSMGLGFWLIVGAFSELAFRLKMFKEPWGAVWRRARHLHRSAYGMTLAHAGVGIMVLGIVAVSAWRAEKVELMKPSDRLNIAGMQIEFIGVKPRQGPNYRANVGIFKAWDGTRLITTLEAAKRTFTANRQQTTEAAIHTFWTGDLYVVLGDKQKDSSYAVRVYYNPLAPFIWLGALIMFFGGLISLSDRRFRVGAPRKAKAKIAKAAKA